MSNQIYHLIEANAGMILGEELNNPESTLTHFITVTLANIMVLRRIIQVQGPPGSGKSRILLLFLIFLKLVRPDLRVIWIAKQNPTLDSTAEDLLELLGPESKLAKETGRFPSWRHIGNRGQENICFYRTPDMIGKCTHTIITFGRMEKDLERAYSALEIDKIALLLADEAQQSQTPKH